MSTEAAPFSESNSSETVARGLFRREDPVLSPFLFSLVAHLHNLLKETRPTQSDWRKAIEFFTEVGHVTDETWHEWVLLSDLLGVTALVEATNTRRPKGATPNAGPTPFYRADAPRLRSGANISLDGIGERLTVRGKVRGLDGCGLVGALIETWQANDKGLYENQQPDLQPEFNLRGAFITDHEGGFHYVTIKPAGYVVPDDGPVGRLLRTVGCPMRRPAHLCFMIKADGFETITTQIFDRAEAQMHEDPLFVVRPELVGDIRREQDDGQSPTWALDVTFVMARAQLDGGAP